MKYVQVCVLCVRSSVPALLREHTELTDMLKLTGVRTIVHAATGCRQV
jgi:hypothetical protein